MIYDDLDEILAESQKFTGTFQIEVENVGFLMNSHESSKITPRRG
ncbi:hypothetical protein JL09_g5640 [Pichia kudriavzevii]|uniref:DNA replication complex GINS protein PSF3 N-terminal domain-containing protein n=1 Tax=Pichia kudriavzevii TaxID=4909 RepID=A0A099NRL2_PICKU|nr:hypothetical protein JL09_g5640 [Pichia kudriavzevii]